MMEKGRFIPNAIVAILTMWVGATVINDISYDIKLRRAWWKAVLAHPFRYIRYRGKPTGIIEVAS